MLLRPTEHICIIVSYVRCILAPFRQACLFSDPWKHRKDTYYAMWHHNQQI
ncbi:hypothetical protein GT037_006454 [Alternaria burnsii]|uniref:Uncharacterized protein n=1 Tax=Alternaria burnsii TaxID=1187904 RepID=A0A8H7EEL0_9PLEO|nr:uncharacterized protein GT037_006454 [Alternaria burnsii]KAF7675735.1 hypothetical protein GT037_006454 [Alternaria burnsii]